MLLDALAGVAIGLAAWFLLAVLVAPAIGRLLRGL